MCMTVNLKQFSLLIVMLLTDGENAGAAKVVSRPSQRYVLEGHQGLVWCQNRSADEQSFYSYVDDAIWYRWTNDNISQLVGSTTIGLGVYSSGHTLIFYPTVRESDEGYYYCCSSAGNLCSDRTDVRISVPPAVTAVKSRFVKAVGSATITLQCNILNPGIPQANIGWKKDGLSINNAHIFTNDTLTSMKLSALTEEDSGLYTCVAIGAYSDHSDSVELIVESPPFITAIKPNYITVSGSKVTLVCMIVRPGEPRAAFGWTKNGESIDNIHSVTINDLFVSITIANVTAQDAGTYTCTATGIESYHSDSIQLHVTLNSEENTTNSSKSQPIIITAEGFSLNCDDSENMGSLFKNLSDYIQRSHGYTVTITASALECVNRFKGIYVIEIITTSVASLNNVLPLLLNDLSAEGLHLGSITIKLCSMECTEMQSTGSDKQDTKFNPSVLAVTILAIMTMIIGIIIILLLVVVRAMKKRRKANFSLKQNLGSTSINAASLKNNQKNTATPEYTEIIPNFRDKLSIMQNSSI